MAWSLFKWQRSVQKEAQKLLIASRSRWSQANLSAAYGGLSINTLDPDDIPVSRTVLFSQKTGITHPEVGTLEHGYFPRAVSPLIARHSLDLFST